MTPHDWVTAENVFREEGKRRKSGDRVVLQRDTRTQMDKNGHILIYKNVDSVNFFCSANMSNCTFKLLYFV